LIAINSSPDAWIVDLGVSHHMAATKEVYSSLDACKGPPILMGDNSPVEVIDKGRIELKNESFKNVSDDKLRHQKRVIFTPDAVDIYDMQTNSRVAIFSSCIR
jgi:hypothetical protein